jgi:hypothetical protein
MTLDITRIKALCQRCHLDLDRPHHIAVRRERWRRRRGQLVLFPEPLAGSRAGPNMCTCGPEDDMRL